MDCRNNRNYRIFKLVSSERSGYCGGISKTLRSVFVGAYKKSIERSNKNVTNTSSVEEQPRMSKLVKFYNWLEEVEGRTSIKSNPNLENWLLW